jgi:hypothetical protein
MTRNGRIARWTLGELLPRAFTPRSLERAIEQQHRVRGE